MMIEKIHTPGNIRIIGVETGIAGLIAANDPKKGPEHFSGPFSFIRS